MGRFVLVSMTMSIPQATSSSPSIFDMTWAGLPVVMLPYMTVAEIPIPCCPLDCLRAWNLDPYSRRPNTLGIILCTIPGPLSSMEIL